MSKGIVRKAEQRGVAEEQKIICNAFESENRELNIAIEQLERGSVRPAQRAFGIALARAKKAESRLSMLVVGVQQLEREMRDVFADPHTSLERSPLVKRWANSLTALRIAATGQKGIR